jgi:nucleotide-binding universal stress UspA family protein
MVVLKNILVATDFSEPSAVAMAYGRDLARSYGAALHVLHVVEDMMVRYGAEIGFASPTCRRIPRRGRGAISTLSSLKTTGRRSS